MERAGQPFPGYESHTGTTSGTDVLDIELNGLSAQYIRIRNLEYRQTWAEILRIYGNRKSK